MKPLASPSSWNFRRCVSMFATVSFIVALANAHAETPLDIPSVKPSSGPWDSGGGFRFRVGADKEEISRKSLSGIACNLNAAQERVCLMAFDEGVQAHFANLQQNALVADLQGLDLLNKERGELDGEGAATDGTYFYVTGSHSVKRHDCKPNRWSRHVIRFRLDPATGRALRSPAGKLVDYGDTERLWSIMKSQPELQAYVGKCLGSEPPPGATKLKGQHGANIEGLAIKDGRLYFGFRGPARDGRANVLAVDAAALFDGGDPRARVTQLALGKGRGVRDMVATEAGFLLLAGPDDDPSHQKGDWTVAWWDGQSIASKTLATLDLRGVEPRKLEPGGPRACKDAKRAKPEAITVLEEAPQFYRLLVLSDGMCDGGALEFVVKR